LKREARRRSPVKLAENTGGYRSAEAGNARKKTLKDDQISGTADRKKFG